jgi:hypothetical protein
VRAEARLLRETGDIGLRHRFSHLDASRFRSAGTRPSRTGTRIRRLCPEPPRVSPATATPAHEETPRLSVTAGLSGGVGAQAPIAMTPAASGAGAASGKSGRVPSTDGFLGTAGVFPVKTSILCRSRALTPACAA